MSAYDERIAKALERIADSLENLEGVVTGETGDLHVQVHNGDSE